MYLYLNMQIFQCFSIYLYSIYHKSLLYLIFILHIVYLPKLHFIYFSLFFSFLTSLPQSSISLSLSLFISISLFLPPYSSYFLIFFLKIYCIILYYTICKVLSAKAVEDNSTYNNLSLSFPNIYHL